MPKNVRFAVVGVSRHLVGEQLHVLRVLLLLFVLLDGVHYRVEGALAGGIQTVLLVDRHRYYF
jgi:hypothetical protein